MNINPDTLLIKMRQMVDQIEKNQPASFSHNEIKSEGFGDVLKNAIDGVNELQKTSSHLGEQHALGNKEVSLSDAVIASRKSGIAFQALLQVRNRFVEAYKEVMNMPM